MLESFDTLVKSIVDDVEGLRISYNDIAEDQVLVTVRASGRDMGRLIGRNGKVANSLRVIISAVGYKNGGDKRYLLEITNNV
jgi:predicted RNA-binding protein YlqC (UPF0109 family)